MTLLSVSDLRVTYDVEPPVIAVDGVTFELEQGECLAIVGESGSGKSTIGKSILGLAPESRRTGSIRFAGMDISKGNEQTMRALRWTRLGLVFQSTTALNPVLSIGDQIDEPQRVHLGVSRADARDVTHRMLADVGLDASVADRFPGELSGGQRRLAAIALALTGEPDVLILDEPTAGLDPTARGRIADILDRLRRVGSSMILLSHDLESVRSVADRVMVLYRGWPAEIGPAESMLSAALHPYTVGFINSRPTLGSLKDIRGIRGNPPDATKQSPGCPFVDRCTQPIESCATERPALERLGPASDGRAVSCHRGGLVTVMKATAIHKTFRVGASGLRRKHVAALAGVDLEIREGEVVGLAGPNGAGKSTLGHILAHLLEPDSGSIEFEGARLNGRRVDDEVAVRRRLQLLFQDPYEALSPRLTVGEMVREPLDIQRLGEPAQRGERVREILDRVRLPSDDAFLRRHSHQLSGGQLQRVALARALILEPKLLVADEPLEGLDPSEQSKVIQLLKQLQVDMGMAMVLVSHDLAVLVRAADRIYVLDRGRIVEHATGTELVFAPKHPVTRKLLSASGRNSLFAERELG